MNKKKTNPQRGGDAPGLSESRQKAALLADWAYQTGHLLALELLDSVLTFREHQVDLPSSAEGHDVGQVVLEGFAATLEPVLSQVLDYIEPSKRERLPRLLLEGLADAAASLFDQPPPCRKGKP
jgi:hypothetical protein